MYPTPKIKPKKPSNSHTNQMKKDNSCICSYSDLMLPFPQWTQVFWKFGKTQAYLQGKETKKQAVTGQMQNSQIIHNVVHS